MGARNAAWCQYFTLRTDGETLTLCPVDWKLAAQAPPGHCHSTLPLRFIQLAIPISNLVMYVQGDRINLLVGVPKV